jgi:hypothetical protein
VADDPSHSHPYRAAWEPARLAITPAQLSTPWALRREMRKLRTQVDAKNLPDRETTVQVIAELTGARDWIRMWARPYRGLLLVMAATMATSVPLAILKQPGSLPWALFGVAMGLIAAPFSEFWVTPWLDLVP